MAFTLKIDKIIDSILATNACVCVYVFVCVCVCVWCVCVYFVPFWGKQYSTMPKNKQQWHKPKDSYIAFAVLSALPAQVSVCCAILARQARLFQNTGRQGVCSRGWRLLLTTGGRRLTTRKELKWLASKRRAYSIPFHVLGHPISVQDVCRHWQLETLQTDLVEYCFPRVGANTHIHTQNTHTTHTHTHTCTGVCDKDCIDYSSILGLRFLQ